MMPLSDELAIGLGDSKGKPTGFPLSSDPDLLLRPANAGRMSPAEIAPLGSPVRAPPKGRSSTGHLRQAEGALPVQRLKAR